MKILHINVNYITSALHQIMIEHFEQFDIENNVFVPSYDGQRSIVDVNDYVKISECYKKIDRLFYFAKQEKILKSLINNYKIKSFDFIHAHTLFTDGNVAMRISKMYGIPYAIAVRNTDLNNFFKYMVHLRPLGIEIMSNASAIFFLSPKYKEELFEKYIPKNITENISKKSYVIPNGIDDFWINNIFLKRNKNTEDTIKITKKLRCLYVGRIDRNKNVGLILESLKILNKRGWDVSLTVIGKIDDKKLFYRLSKYTFFNYIQPMPKEELINFYRKSDIFIMPSHKETFGLVYAEAMSQGLPVIYTRGQGFDGQFLEGEVGYSVDDNDVYDTILMRNS